MAARIECDRSGQTGSTEGHQHTGILSTSLSTVYAEYSRMSKAMDRGSATVTNQED